MTLRSHQSGWTCSFKVRLKNAHHTQVYIYMHRIPRTLHYEGLSMLGSLNCIHGNNSQSIAIVRIYRYGEDTRVSLLGEVLVWSVVVCSAETVHKVQVSEYV